MEVAGLVLGGLPLALYALDNYHRCLQVTKDYWRFKSTIQVIRNHIFIEQEQLRVTLRSIGLANPSRSDLEEHLRQMYPDKCKAFMDIITHMESLLADLMRNLDIDSRGKPKWTDEPPDRAFWEWRRVRTSFGRRARQELVKELRYWNNALRLCFEKSELPLESDAPNATLESVKAKFNAKTCKAIRDRARQVHVAVSQSWTCQSHSHRGNLKLAWHTEGLLQPAKINVAMSTPGSALGAPSEAWHELDFEAVEQPYDGESYSIPLHPPAPATPDATLHPRKRLKAWFRQKSPSRGVEMADVTPPSRSPSPFMNPQDTVPLPEVGCLCSFLRDSKPLGRLDVDDDGSFRRVTLRVQQQQPGPGGPAQVVPLRAFLASTLGAHSQVPSRHLLSRKDRLAVAAAATWAVLFLADSPWIAPDWSAKDFLYMFSENPAPLTRYYTTLSVVFKGLADAPYPTAADALEPDHLRSGLIRNRTLFALGILLIELCLNKPFERLRQEYRAESFSASLGVRLPLDDYEIANNEMQNVYDDAGDFYGYAVQRCLRCEFPGRDITKTFEFDQFRRDFFYHVVAPVQATYILLPSSYMNV